MLDIGFGELILLGAIALIALGPKQLPEVARTVARFINDMKRVAGDLAGDWAGAIGDARESTDRLLKFPLEDKKPEPVATADAVAAPKLAAHPEAPLGEHPHPRFALAPEHEPLSPEEEADRRRQMSFAILDAHGDSGDNRG